jgi:ABC-type glycerol-3-phosphate transport system permease component
VSLRSPVWHRSRAGLSILAALVMFFPIYWLIISSFKETEQLFRGNVLFPSLHSTLKYYAHVVSDGRFWLFVANSAIVGLATTVLVVAFSTLGAYSLARLGFPGSRTIANTVLFVYMVPPVLLAIPIYLWMFRLGLLNTRASVVFAHVALALPFAIWMMRGFFASLPKDLEDAARIDGCTYMGVIWRVILPLSANGIVAVATYTLIGSWNDYIMAFMLISRGQLYTLPVGLVVLFQSTDLVQWGEVMAGSVLSAVPVIGFFFAVQRLLVRGITAGAVKG